MQSDNNYIKVYSYMIRDLKLSGYELLLYALINSFTKNSEEKCYYGSQIYLANWLGTTRARVNMCLKKLLEKGLVIKSSITVDNKIFTSYVCQNDTQYVSKQNTKVYQNRNQTCIKMEHNKNIYNNKDKNIDNNIYNDLVFM